MVVSQTCWFVNVVWYMQKNKVGSYLIRCRGGFGWIKDLGMKGKTILLEVVVEQENDMVASLAMVHSGNCTEVTLCSNQNWIDLQKHG